LFHKDLPAMIDAHHGSPALTCKNSRACCISPGGYILPRPRLENVGSPRAFRVSAMSKDSGGGKGGGSGIYSVFWKIYVINNKILTFYLHS
jgi:hypothetical protein